MLSTADVRALLPYPYLIDSLAAGIDVGFVTPPRHYHPLGGNDDFLLLMPAWSADGFIGTKLCGVFPDNPAGGGEVVCEAYVLMERASGRVVAVCEGLELTNRRTAAASALAARALARDDARTLLVMGTGAIAPYVAAAHASVRAYDSVLVWGRDFAKATLLAAVLRDDGLPAEAVRDARDAAGRADTISCATGATTPILSGSWIRPGTHIDLIGSHSPNAREADGECVRRSRVFVDLRESALREAGDLLMAIDEHLFDADAIAGDLADLARPDGPRRGADDDLTLFKSVGFAAEDLIAALAAMRARQG